jgi:Cd2+/Zn2+-exporting ATPase/Cu+-exporting ATPase
VSETRTLEIAVRGMDCADCVRHVERAIAGLSGVERVDVLLAAEKAVVQLGPDGPGLSAIREAVERAGYSVPREEVRSAASSETAGGTERGPLADVGRRVMTLLGILFGVVVLIAVVGEWLDLLEAATERIPWPVWLVVIGVVGWPAFREVAGATLRGRVVSHTLMTLGAVAAMAVGEWATAAVVAFFMRVGAYVESFTTERGRQAVKQLLAQAPRRARVEREGAEVMVNAEDVRVGETVIVRPGEEIPVDGEVVGGRGTVDQSAVTGEPIPVEAGPGVGVFAATLVHGGSLRVRATHVGANSTFGRIVRMVQEAEAHRGRVQRLADRFSAYYLPAVLAVAALTLLLRRDPLATAAVLVVACSCSFALATPIAILASVGSGAKRGLLIKGGRHLESLARVDVLLIDKTGTLTLGRPRITDVLPLGLCSDDELLSLAASAERYSEHPLAEAVRAAARERRVPLLEPAMFESLPGMGVRAEVEGSTVLVGTRKLMDGSVAVPGGGETTLRDAVQALEAEGKTTLLVACDAEIVGVLAAADTLRPEVPAALEAVRAMGVRQVELLTGDNERAASALAGALGIPYRAGLLPEDKIAIVRERQGRGHTVAMVGDGVNDAPALAQADVGVAMGAAGSGIALEAAHVALLRDDWTLVPHAFRIARRTMRVVKVNIAFTAVYNLAGLTLAALGFLPPILAAAAQSLPDLGILANSSRLLRDR